MPVIRSLRPCYLPTLAMVCALAACGGDTTQPGGDGSPKSITGLWNASVSGIKGQTPGGQPTTCTASWVMSIDSFPENDPDPLLTIIPYTAPIACNPGASGIWSERGQIFAVRQSGDSFTFVSALRGDTFFVAHMSGGNALTARMVDFTYRDATFGATRRTSGGDPNLAPFELDLQVSFVDAEVGDSAPITVHAYDAYFREIPDPSVQWTSSAPAVATVRSNGMVIGASPGNTTISATLDTLVRSVPFTVLTPPASIVIVSAPDSLIDTDRVYVQAEARDAGNQPLPNRRFHWSSSNPAVATVVDAGDQGYVQPTGLGTVTITAANAGLSASADIRVVAATAQIVQPPAKVSGGARLLPMPLHSPR